MAEINVQRKRPGGWLLIFGILAALGLVWVLVVMFRPDDFNAETVQGPATVPASAASETAATSGISGAPPAAVAAFLTFKDASVGSPAGPAHEYTAGGIRRLAQALDTVVERDTVAGTPLRDRLAALQAKADQIQADPQAVGHANQVRDVFTDAADILAAAQQDRWPDDTQLITRIDETRKAAAAIDGSRPLLDQTEQVKAFFDRAGAALVAIPASAPR